VREAESHAPADDREGSWAAAPMPEPPQPGADDATELHSTLARISARLAELERRLV
jgi:hypothetical protein